MYIYYVCKNFVMCFCTNSTRCTTILYTAHSISAHSAHSSFKEAPSEKKMAAIMTGKLNWLTRGGWTCVISHVIFDPYMYVYICTRTPCRWESGVRRPTPRSRQRPSGSQKSWTPSRTFLAHGTNLTTGCKRATP